MKLNTLYLSAVASAIITANTVAHAEEATVKISNGGIKIKQGDASLQIGGRFMLDYDSFDGVHNASNNGNSGSDSEIRRGRIFIKSAFNKNWETKLQINVDDKGNKDRFEDAYLKYKGLSIGTVTIGKHKEGFGLEELTSSKYISTVERSMMTNAFAPGRSYGVSVTGHKDKFNYSVGLFKLGQDQNDDQTYSFTARLAYAPIMEKNNLLHFGIAASTRDYSGNSYQISERAEVHLANDKPAQSIASDADKVSLLGLESAWVNGPLSLQVEYQQASVSAVTGSTDADYSGYYIMGSYFFTGESRPYKKGAFSKIKPQSSDGAWELVLRKSNLDLVDNLSGTQTDNTTVGLNYYANASVRFMFNYITTDVEGPNYTGEKDGNAISLRAQYIF